MMLPTNDPANKEEEYDGHGKGSYVYSKHDHASSNLGYAKPSVCRYMYALCRTLKVNVAVDSIAGLI